MAFGTHWSSLIADRMPSEKAHVRFDIKSCAKEINDRTLEPEAGGEMGGVNMPALLKRIQSA